MPDATAIHDLPQLTWQGTKLYATDIETSWSHALVQREYLDVDGEAHDWTGRKSLEVSATVHFLNTIEPGLYGKWPAMRDGLLKGEPGTLRHPEIGTFQCRAADVSYTITARSTAGVSVRVHWIESIKAADQPTQFASDESAGAAAAAADEAISFLGIDYPDGMQTTSFSEMVSQFESFGTILDNEINGKIANTIGMVDSMFGGLQSACKAQSTLDPASKALLAASPYRQYLERSLNDLRWILVQAQELAKSKARPTAIYKTTNDSNLATLSLEIPADINDLVLLNPKLLATPIVSKGASVTYYKAA